MDDELSEARVFADELQAAGDPRGELLALELAAEHAPTSVEARRLNRAAQRIRDAHHELVWPPALRESWAATRAGFVVRSSLDHLVSGAVDPKLWLSARSLFFFAARLEDHAPQLTRAWASGLSLAQLSWSGMATSGPPTHLGVLGPAIRDAPNDPVRALHVGGRCVELETLARCPGLRRLDIHGQLSTAQLRSLEPLALEHLRIVDVTVNPELPALFADTLRSVSIYSPVRSLAPLARLPRLRELYVTGAHPQHAATLAQLAGLESLTLAKPGSRALIEALAGLGLSQLHLPDELPAALVPALAKLEQLETLRIHETSAPFELELLSGLTRLRELELPPEIEGAVELPARLACLRLTGPSSPVELYAEVDRLELTNGDLRGLPAGVLAGLRELELVWYEAPDDALLAELPSLCPRLERLQLHPVGSLGRTWTWPDGPDVLDALPELRSFELRGVQMHEQAELARAFPGLYTLDRSVPWPRSLAPRARARRRASRVSVEQDASAASLETAVADPAWAPLREWAAHLRERGDARGELLELELAAELSDDPTEARAFNRAAHKLRASERELAWPAPLRRDIALLRGGMPVFTSSSWLDQTMPPLELAASLRAARVDRGSNMSTCLTNLLGARAFGLRLETLTLASDERVFDQLDVLDRFTELDALALLSAVDREQLQRHPAQLRLRRLELGHGTAAPGAWLARFASTLTALSFLDAPASALATVELPELEQLSAGAAGWRLDWLQRLTKLRNLSVDVDGLGADAIEGLTALELDELAVIGPIATLAGLLPAPADLDGLGLVVSEASIASLDPLRLERLADSTLRELTLIADVGPTRLPRTLELPDSLDMLTLHTGDAVRPLGRVGRLSCEAETLRVLPAQLCAEVVELVVEGNSEELVDRLIFRFDRLERLEVDGQRVDVGNLVRRAGYLPCLRSLTLHGMAVGELMELSPVAPGLQLHGSSPGWRELERWPRPPDAG